MEKPYSQKLVARFIGVSPQRLCDLKAGRYGGLSKRTALRVSALTGITVHDLFAMDYENFMKAMGQAMDERKRKMREGA